MASSDTTFPTPSSGLLRYLDAAQFIVGNDFLPQGYRELLADLTSVQRLVDVDGDDGHPLWWFLPSILYDLFDEKLEFDWLKQNEMTTQSVVVVFPPFVSIAQRLQQELEEYGLVTASSTRLFSRRFVGLLYGGYPWFESYIRICDSYGLSGQACVIFRVASDTGDVPRTLEAFKRQRRDSFGLPLQIEFDDLPYPGVIRPFHAPARIENRRHIRAVDSADV